jgi:hypothetical protein
MLVSMIAGQCRMIYLRGKGINIYKHTHPFVNWLTVELSEIFLPLPFENYPV